MISFEWDPKKALSNLAKHRVSFEEAKTAFEDEGAFVVSDPEHSLDEDREILTGLSLISRVLVTVFVERESGSRIRIISARRATRRESDFYYSRNSK